MAHSALLSCIGPRTKEVLLASGNNQGWYLGLLPLSGAEEAV